MSRREPLLLDAGMSRDHFFEEASCEQDLATGFLLERRTLDPPLFLDGKGVEQSQPLCPYRDRLLCLPKIATLRAVIRSMRGSRFFLARHSAHVVSPSSTRRPSVLAAHACSHGPQSAVS